jgi:hypothetical protein
LFASHTLRHALRRSCPLSGVAAYCLHPTSE